MACMFVMVMACTESKMTWVSHPMLRERSAARGQRGIWVWTWAMPSNCDSFTIKGATKQLSVLSLQAIAGATVTCCAGHLYYLVDNLSYLLARHLW